jgi:hypothetical protein
MFCIEMAQPVKMRFLPLQIIRNSDYFWIFAPFSLFSLKNASIPLEKLQPIFSQTLSSSYIVFKF